MTACGQDSDEDIINDMFFGDEVISSKLPKVTTKNVSGINNSNAFCGGNISSQGGSSVTARGVCWNTSPTPTLNHSFTSNGVGVGTFSSAISGLASNTVYYVRAYATNSFGTAYGNEISFRSATYTTTIPTNGLVARYPFNGNANDESGNGNNGVVNGASLTTDRKGNSNSAYSFNGLNNSISTSFKPSNIFSISLWFKPNSSQVENAGLFSTYYDYDFYGCYLSFNNGIFYLFFDGNNGTQLSTVNLSYNNWNNIVITSDGSIINVFLNKNIIKSISGKTTHVGNIIFGDSRYNDRFFRGSIDDILIYNRALSGDEVLQIYNATN